MNVTNRIKTLRKRLEAIKTEIDKIQSECPHPKEHVEYIHRSDTGNWSTSDDRYWTTYMCLQCGKFWTETGSTGNASKGTKVQKFSEPMVY
jgi:hypothetical protein